MWCEVLIRPAAWCCRLALQSDGSWAKLTAGKHLWSVVCVSAELVFPCVSRAGRCVCVGEVCRCVSPGTAAPHHFLSHFITALLRKTPHFAAAAARLGALWTTCTNWGHWSEMELQNRVLGLLVLASLLPSAGRHRHTAHLRAEFSLTAGWIWLGRFHWSV